jgi:hypothetical protein
MKKITLLSFAFATLIFNEIYAQDSGSEPYKFFNIGLGFATGEFGDNDREDEDAGLAGIGAGIGFGKAFGTKIPNLNVLLGMDVNVNLIDSEVADEIEDFYLSQGVEGDLKYSQFYNVPVTIGAAYAIPLNDVQKLRLNLGFGVNAFYISKASVEGNVFGSDYEVETTYSPSVKPCVKFGAAFQLSSFANIYFNYFGLGNHEVSGTSEIKNGTFSGSNDFEIDRKVSILNIGLGFTF